MREKYTFDAAKENVVNKQARASRKSTGRQLRWREQ
jgi:hypothetical protein